MRMLNHLWLSVFEIATIYTRIKYQGGKKEQQMSDPGILVKIYEQTVFLVLRKTRPNAH